MLLYYMGDIAKDKVLHMYYLLLLYILLNMVIPPYLSIIIVYIVALLKEVYDGTVPEHTSDIFDVYYGVFTPTILFIIYTIRHFIV